MKPAKGTRLVFGYLGNVTVIIGMIMLIPLFVLPFYPEETKYLLNFLIPGIVTIILGILLSFLIYKKPHDRLKKNQDAIIVVLCWIIAFIICTMPFLLKSDGETYNFSQALFEVVSGFTTTGITIIDVQNAPKIYLFYCSVILFFGGAGLILILLCIFKDGAQMSLYNAEGRDDRLFHNVTKTTRGIMIIYTVYVILGILLYIVCGMNTFDAIIHSISGVATGGFSTKYENIAYYDSLGIELVSIFLMLLGSINFLAHLYLLRGKFKNFFRYTEVKLMFLTIILSTVIFSLVIFTQISDVSYGYSLRISLFHIVSAVSGTGFNLVKIDYLYKVIPSFFLIIVILTIIGGNTGSTSSGIKTYRLGIVLKNIKWKLSDALHYGSSLKRMPYIYRLDGREYIDNKKVSTVFAFIITYILVILAVIFLYGVLDGEATFQMIILEGVSTVSTAGFSTGIIAYDAHKAILWVAIIGMFLGRLEIYIVLLCFIRLTRNGRRTFDYHGKKRRKIKRSLS